MRWVFLFFLCCVVRSYAQDFSLGARSAGMANATVALSDAHSFQHNVATLTFVEYATLGFSVKNSFALKTLNIGGVEFMQPSSLGAFRIALMHYGDELYSESQVGLAYARLFGKALSAGMQLQYRNTRLGADYGSKNNLLVDVGLHTKVSKNLAVGVQLANPNRTVLSTDYNERYPTVFRMGLEYKVSDKVLLLTEGEKRTQERLLGKMGLEYQFKSSFYLRTGITTNPIQNSFGFGVCWNNFSMALSTMRHWSLGYVSQCTMRVQLGR